MSKFCSNCGTQIDDAPFCKNCGAKSDVITNTLPNQPGTPPEQQPPLGQVPHGNYVSPKTKRNIIIASISAFMALIIIITVVLATAGKKYEGEWTGSRKTMVDRLDLLYEYTLILNSENYGELVVMANSGDGPSYLKFEASIKDDKLHLYYMGYTRSYGDELIKDECTNQSMDLSVNLKKDEVSIGSYNGNDFYPYIAAAFPVTLKRSS